MTSVPRSPARCSKTFEMGHRGPNRLIRTCLRADGHQGECDFVGITIAKHQENIESARSLHRQVIVGGLLVAALLMMVLLVLFLPPAALAQTVDSKPRCAILNIAPPRILGSNPKAQRFIWAEFVNTCLDPVMEMGSYACLEEIATPGGPPKVIDCHANIDRSPFTMLSPHETSVFMVAKCNYTTIPRYYKVTGYAWAISLPIDSVPPEMKYYRTPKKSSRVVTFAKSGPGDVHFCDIAPAGTSWRNFR